MKSLLLSLHQQLCFEIVVFLSMLLTPSGTHGESTAISNWQYSFYYNNVELEDAFTFFHCIDNISVYCPSWSYCNKSDGICKCPRKTEDAIRCAANNMEKGLILNCYCLTENEYMNTTELGMCLYNCDYMGKEKLDIDMGYSPLPYNRSDLDHNMCGRYNRTGTLCGRCINNTYLRAYSYDMTCTSCGSVAVNIVKYVVVAYVPLTLFCVIVMMLRLNVPSSQIQGFVFFSQILSNPILARHALNYFGKNQNCALFRMVQFFGTIYGIWNLDFFRLLPLNICFEAHPLTVLSLDFFVAVYPLFLTVMIYVLTLCYDSNFTPVVKLLKPFKSIAMLFVHNWDIKTSTIDAFVTFFFLSNVKFLSVCFDLLVPVKICDISEKSSCRLAVFYDASVQYFSHEHIPYAVLAIIVLIVFIIIPIITLVIYPFSLFQKCLVVLPNRWQLLLHMLMDSLQGCYKNGTEAETKDCRWFSAVPFFVRFIIFSVYAAVILFPFVPYFAMMLVVTVAITIIADPYKFQFIHYSIHHNVFLLFLASIITCALEMDYNISILAKLLSGFIGIMHLLYAAILTLKWVIVRRKFQIPL